MMRFGFGMEDITPARGIALDGYFEPRYNTGFLDHLSVKAVLFADDKKLCGIVSYDLCTFPRELVDRMIAALKDANMPFGENLVFCCTHTHTGPYTAGEFADKAYLESVVSKTVNAVHTAFTGLAEAEFLTGLTECATLSFNRRFWMKDGTVLTNPGKLNPEIVKPEGTIDPEIPILAIRQDGMLRLLIVNISNHSDTIGGSLTSADWPGRMEREIQKCLGYDIPVITLLACQGDINHFNVKTNANQTCYEEAVRIGCGYAHEILSRLYSLQPLTSDSFSIESTKFEAPYVRISDAEYNAAKQIFDSIGEISAASADDLTSEGLAKGNRFVQRLFAKRVMDCRDNPIPGRRDAVMTAIRFGKEFGIIAIPAEPFIEIQLAIKKASRFPVTMVGALSQGYIGYIGMPESYERGGGYETRPQPSAPAHDLGPRIRDVAISLLNNAPSSAESHGRAIPD